MMSRRLWKIVSLIVAGLAFSPLASANETNVTLNTRPGVTLSYLLRTPPNPIAAVILFAGDDGNLKLDGTQIGSGKNNFLVRTRHLFADRGLQVAVVDAPSDRKYVDGMQRGFRMSPEHVTDIQAVIADLKNRSAVPVWLIGTSRGTESAAYVGLHRQQQIGGIVLTSAITQSNRIGRSVTTLDLESLRLSVLIVAHKQDGCEHAPASGAERIKKALTQSATAKVLYVEGGAPPRSSACEALAPHGFFGVEQQVVDAIAAFIKSRTYGYFELEPK